MVNDKMKESALNARVEKQLEILIERYPSLDVVKKDIFEAYRILEYSYTHGDKLLVCGNGGSAADSEHIVGELMKGFKKPRKLGETAREVLRKTDPKMGKVLGEHLQGALSAIALDGHPALNTAYMNDCEPLLCFAQQVNGYGRQEDVLLGISTSGNSKNVLYAVVTARAIGMKVIGLTGSRESRLSSLADVCIRVPETETYKVQELHLPVYHCLCLMLEERFFGGNC
jgi:D-sedoheptulose 7-phosphate isomerase